MQPEDQQALITRLRSSQDRLRRIVLMIESGQPCPEILQQVAELRATLRALRRQLIRMEAQICIELLQSNTSQEQQRELAGLLLAMYQV